MAQGLLPQMVRVWALLRPCKRCLVRHLVRHLNWNEMVTTSEWSSSVQAQTQPNSTHVDIIFSASGRGPTKLQCVCVPTLQLTHDAVVALGMTGGPINGCPAWWRRVQVAAPAPLRCRNGRYRTLAVPASSTGEGSPRRRRATRRQCVLWSRAKHGALGQTLRRVGSRSCICGIAISGERATTRHHVRTRTFLAVQSTMDPRPS